MDGRFAKNGAEIVLVADGGVFGRLIECNLCLGTGCVDCSGSGKLHKPWHPIDHMCYSTHTEADAFHAGEGNA